MTATNEPENKHWSEWWPPPKFTGKSPGVEVSEHPKYFDGQLFNYEELYMMGEGDYNNRLDADYFDSKE